MVPVALGGGQETTISVGVRGGVFISCAALHQLLLPA